MTNTMERTLTPERTFLNVANITLEDLYLRAKAIEDKSEDFIVENLRYSSMSDKSKFGNLSFIANGKVYEAALSKWSFVQLCLKLHIPSKYALWLKENDNPYIECLFAQNMNTLLVHSEEKNPTLLRTMVESDEANNKYRYMRAILTDKYTIYDSNEVMREVLNTIRRAKSDYVIKGWQIDDTGMHLRLVDPKPIGGSKELDDLYLGIVISTGDIGNRTLEVSALIYKKVCTNGLIVKKFEGAWLKRRHLGKSAPELQETIVAALENIPTLADNIRAYVTATDSKPLEAAEFEQMLKSLQNFTGKLTDEETKEIKEKVMITYNPTIWGYINALTEFAQKERFDLDKRMEIESHAADLLVTFGSKLTGIKTI